MPLSVNPIIPVIAAQAAAPDLVLQPGSVVDAQVLKLLSDNLVRITIAGLSIDVFSEIPLQPGQALQLAVSQTESGVRLAVIGQGPGTAPGIPSTGPSSVGISSAAVALAPKASVDVAANPAPIAVATNPSLNVAPPTNQLTPLERLAVSTAVEIAATQQGSQAPLFANLGLIAASAGLPPKLQQTVMQVLAQQTSLDQNLSGGEVKNAFQKSGLFLEASIASGTILPATGVPDLKAALIVLRQTLLSSLGTAGAGPNPAATVTIAQQPVVPATPVTSAADAAPPPHPATASTLVPSLPPETEAREILLPQARVPVAHYEHTEIGFNYRLSNLSAAVGVGQLEGVEARIDLRAEDRNLPGGFDAQAHPTVLQLHHRHDDPIADQDPLTGLARQDQHGGSFPGGSDPGEHGGASRGVGSRS